jgi:hypothetical protein
MGARISIEKKDRCRRLLRDTDMTIAAIARRLGISDRAAGMINKLHGVRRYDGDKWRVWTQDGERIDMRIDR